MPRQRSARPANDITQILVEEGRGGWMSRSAADRVFAAAYDELRSIAERAMRREQPGHTLQPTALLNETYIRLVDASQVRWEDRAHFFGIATKAMRQVLIDHFRERHAQKRGGGWQRIELEEDVALSADNEIDIVELDDALTRLEAENERLARVVELRIFAGLSGEEIGAVLGVSRKTVTEDWRLAVMFLRAILAGEEGL